MNPRNFFAERRSIAELARPIAAAVLCVCVSAAVAAPSRPRVDEVAAIVAAGMKEQGIPGAALVVMKGDEIILARGFGVEDAAREDRVTENSIFALGSITKQFTAAAILQLVEQRRLALDDPVAHHLPDFTHLPADLKIQHLLSHTSGIREEFAQPELTALFAQPGTTYEEYVDAARHSPSDWPPGSRWSYGNINYLLLGLIVERVDGQPLEVVFDERFFKPLELRSFRLCPPQTGEVPGEARGHVNRDGALVPLTRRRTHRCSVAPADSAEARWTSRVGCAHWRKAKW
ncbi:MAG: beta-lactamase family protein [Chthoniobacterales bacterium]|nr:beta-lactamase family protein [Chthoniobacterales bacterium]